VTELPFPRVDADGLPDDYRAILKPGESLKQRDGRRRVLPRLFLRVDSWEDALETQLTPNFAAWELISVDVREAPPMRSFPRYVPCAILLLAAALELFRREVGTYVHVAANGGYRSPGHQLSRQASRHCWGTAANIYRVGDEFLDTRESIEQYAAIARRLIPGVWIRPFGTADGQVDDHLHIDLGYTTFEPLESDDEEASSRK
jgi:hypothetical protein